MKRSYTLSGSTVMRSRTGTSSPFRSAILGMSCPIFPRAHLDALGLRFLALRFLGLPFVGVCVLGLRFLGLSFLGLRFLGLPFLGLLFVGICLLDTRLYVDL